MKKVLVRRTALPLTMSATFNAIPTPITAPPCAMPSLQDKIPKLMFEVVFENTDIMVLRGILTYGIYTIDKSRGVTIYEPDYRELVIYHHLHKLGITDNNLNVFHHDTLVQLFESGNLRIDEGARDYES